MTRWFVTGAGGQLATAFAAALEGDVFMAREEALDLRDAEALATTVRAFRPDMILHTAAYTDVDGAESDEETAFAVNALGTRNLVAAVRGTHVPVVYFSTDYVFDGAKRQPYVESDEPNPLSAYGRTKLAGERETLAWPHGIVIRTAWLFSITGRNFVKTILSAARKRVESAAEPLCVVDDQIGSPTYAPHLAHAALAALRAGLGPGVYHMAGAGCCSWCEFAREIVALAGLDVPVEPLASAELGRPAPRPAFSALATERAIPVLPHWADGVAAAVDELLERDEETRP